MNNKVSALVKGGGAGKKSALGAGFVVLLILPFIMKGINYTYAITLACYIEMYYIAVSGYDILFGYCGQINMGLAGFFAIGAYGSGILHNYLGIPVIASMLMASVVAAAVGAALAYPCAKLQFHFLTLATIAFGEIINQLISHSPGSITGNFNGMFSDSVSVFGLTLDNSTGFFYFGLVCAVLFSLLKLRIVKSKIGRALSAIRDNVKAADGMGIDVRKYKMFAFAASALFAGFSGGMYMHLVGYVSPDTFTQKQSVMFLTMLLFGGTTSFGGTILGVALIMILTEFMRSFTGYQTLIYGALILVVVLVIPGGIYGTITNLFKQRRGSGRNAKGGIAQDGIA